MSFLFYLAVSMLALSVLLAAVSLTAFQVADVVLGTQLGIITILAVFLATALMVIASGSHRRGSRATGYVSIIGVWICLPLLAALPFPLLAPDLSFSEALFEATSGLTTTGATIISNLDTANRPLLFWRANLQWFGGFITLATIFLLLAPAQVGGLAQTGLHQISERAAVSRLSALATIAPILLIYVLLTVIAVVALLIAQLPAFDAVALAMSSISTGGFTVRAGPLDGYDNAAAEIILTVTMFAGASSFLWIRYVIDRNWGQAGAHRESYVLAAAIIGLGVVFGAILFRSAGSADVLHPLDALREGVFHAASLLSTTGLETRTAGLLIVPVPLAIALIFVGGASFSTTGGLQIFRVGAMLLQSVRELNKLLYPSSVQKFRLGSEDYTIQIMKNVWAHAFVFGLTFGVGLIALSLVLPSFEMALLAAASLLANAGPVYSAGAAVDINWIGFADFSVPGHYMAIVMMLLGRAQTLVLLGALTVLLFHERRGLPLTTFSRN